MPMMGPGGRRPRGVATVLGGRTPAGQPTYVKNMARAQMRKSVASRTPMMGRTGMPRPSTFVPPGAKTAATEARGLGGFLRGKRGLAIGAGALAFGMYEMGKNRSSGRNGIQPGSSGGMGY